LKTVTFTWKNVRKALVVVSAAAILAAGGCSGQKSITVGISANSAPMSSRDGDGSPDGFIVEMAREAGKRMGVSINFKYVDMSKGTTNFTNQGVDALWGEIVPDASNSKSMLFTEPYLYDEQMLIVKDDSRIDSSNDINGKAVGAVSGSLADKALSADQNLTIKGGLPAAYKEPVTAFMALDNGEIDALAVDETYALNRMEQHAADYRLLDESLSHDDYAVALRRNDSRLQDAFDKALDAMKADGTSAAISKKWFGSDLTADTNSN
jgi:polar amino acid transport system substrate-binding protein